jgi:hypothetical protein
VGFFARLLLGWAGRFKAKRKGSETKQLRDRLVEQGCRCAPACGLGCGLLLLRQAAARAYADS